MTSYMGIRVVPAKYTSNIVPVSSGNIELPISSDYPHTFAAVSFFADILGNNKVVPTAGTITFTAETEELPGVFQALTNGTIEAKTPGSATMSGNVKRVRASFTGIVGAAYAQLRVTSNYS